MNGFLWVIRAAMFACCLSLLFQLMPAGPAIDNGKLPVVRNVDNIETQNLQQKLMEMSSRRYAGLAP